MPRPCRAAAIAALLLPVALRAQPAPQPYHVATRTVLGGEGGWDYLLADAPNRRLFVTRGTHVMVVSADSPRVIGDIPGTLGVHGVALAPLLGRGFTSNGRDTSVTIFDLRTLAPIRTVKVTGRNPDAIVYDSVSRRVFTMNGGGNNATAVDAATGEIAGTVALGGRPEAAVSDGQGHVWVNLEDRSEIEEFDARSLRSLGHWPLVGCEEPSGIAMDVRHGRVFSVCSNKHMAVFDAGSRRTLTTVDIGEGPDAAAYDPETRTVFSSNGEGSITMIHQDTPNSYHVEQTVQTERGARTVALDARTHRLYTVTAQFGPPPAPSPDNPRPRRTIVPGSFVLLTVAR